MEVISNKKIMFSILSQFRKQFALFSTAVALIATLLAPIPAFAQSRAGGGGLKDDIGELELPKTEGVKLDQIRDFVVNGVNFFLGFILVFAVLMALVGGYQILASAGDEAAYKKGLTYLKNAVVAILLVFGIGIVLNTILSLLEGNSFLSIFGV